jgi:monovalent cation/hydrogen antiporter
VIFLAAGVIICSLIIASLTLPRIARGLVEPGEDAGAAEERLARVGAANAAISHIESLAGADDEGEGDVPGVRLAAANGIVAAYRRRIVASDEADEEARAEMHEARKLELDLRLAGIGAERDALRAMLRRGEINDHTAQALFTEITLTEALLKGRQTRK